MTLIEGQAGVVVMGPLISAETAAAALGLYRAQRGDKPVTGVIYSHSHIDHLGGVFGVTTTMHNVLTLCGALVRDARVWAQYLTQTINLYARKVDVSFGSHHWPTWGTDKVVAYLSLQRDTCAYQHDQTLRLLCRAPR